jgi:hypothetical protein
MERWASIEVVQERLRQWERELETNQHGMAHLAERSVKLLKEELNRRFDMNMDPNNNKKRASDSEEG